MTPPLKPIPDELDYPAGSAGALAQILASQLGYREGVDNDTAFGVWYPMNRQPWCAMFVSWGAWQAGIPTSIIPKHAYTPAGADWFEARGQLHQTPQVGDLGYVYYPSQGRIGHVFFVERIRYVDGVLLMDTLEGNTNDTGSSQGNGVYRLLRADTSNLSYGRPAYAAGSEPPPAGEGEGQLIDPSEEDPMRYVTVTVPAGDPTVYGYTDTEWSVVTQPDEPGAFGLAVRNINARQRDLIRSRVFANAASRGQSSIDLVRVVGEGAETGRTFAILGDSWWEPGAEELGSLLATFGAERVREINQRQLDVVQARLNALDA